MHVFLVILNIRTPTFPLTSENSGINKQKSQSQMDFSLSKSKTTACGLVSQKSDNDVNIHPSIKKNITPCPFIIRRGWCFKGENCDFSHTGLIIASNSNQSLVTPKHMVPCPFLFRKGFCRKGCNCDFYHALVNRTTPNLQESGLPGPNNTAPTDFYPSYRPL